MAEILAGKGAPEVTLAATVAGMRRLIRRAADSPTVGSAVAWIRHGWGADPRAFVLGAWRLCGAVPYEYDPPTVELVRSADQFLEGLGHLAGDCDDQTVFLGSILHHVNAPTRNDRLRLALVSTRADKIPHHVFLVWKDCPLDPIMSTGGRIHPATRQRWPGWWIGHEAEVSSLQFVEV